MNSFPTLANNSGHSFKVSSLVDLRNQPLAFICTLCSDTNFQIQIFSFTLKFKKYEDINM